MTNDKSTKSIELKDLENRIRNLELLLNNINRNNFHNNNQNLNNNTAMEDNPFNRQQYRGGRSSFNSHHNPFMTSSVEGHNRFGMPSYTGESMWDRSFADAGPTFVTSSYEDLDNMMSNSSMFNIRTKENIHCSEMIKNIEKTHILMKEILSDHVGVRVYAKDFSPYSVDIIIALFNGNEPIMFFNRNLFNYKLLLSGDEYKLKKIESVE